MPGSRPGGPFADIDFVIRRSVHFASYSFARLRGWVIIVSIAAFSAGVGAGVAAANLALVGALGLAEFDNGPYEGHADTLAAFAITLACAAAVAALVVFVCDRFAPRLVRAHERDRLQSRWGLRWVGISFAMTPFLLVCVVLALLALGFDING